MFNSQDGSDTCLLAFSSAVTLTFSFKGAVS